MHISPPDSTTSKFSTNRGFASFGDRCWFNVVESIDVARTPERLSEGSWVLVATFEGKITAWRFANSETDLKMLLPDNPWHGPAADSWLSSMSQDAYCSAVDTVRDHIHEGDVYQANICRILSAPLSGHLPESDLDEPSAAALHHQLSEGNPSPFGGVIHVPHGLTDDAGEAIEPMWLVTASPELFVRIDADGHIASSPIKGTAPQPHLLLDKDRAENIMITDLVRNDLQRVCQPGTIRVDPLLAVEEHPGLVHLVSTVHGKLLPAHAPHPQWADIFNLTFPPGSVSGAPKESALTIIRSLETAPRGPYCGAIGWIDADSHTAELAVGIRTFWWEKDEQNAGYLRFGTGAGITWESQPQAEWEETVLKARRLISLASGQAARDSPTIDEPR